MEMMDHKQYVAPINASKGYSGVMSSSNWGNKCLIMDTQESDRSWQNIGHRVREYCLYLVSLIAFLYIKSVYFSVSDRYRTGL